MLPPDALRESMAMGRKRTHKQRKLRKRSKPQRKSESLTRAETISSTLMERKAHAHADEQYKRRLIREQLRLGARGRVVAVTLAAVFEEQKIRSGNGLCIANDKLAEIVDQHVKEILCRAGVEVNKEEKSGE